MFGHLNGDIILLIKLYNMNDTFFIKKKKQINKLEKLIFMVSNV